MNTHELTPQPNEKAKKFYLRLIALAEAHSRAHTSSSIPPQQITPKLTTTAASLAHETKSAYSLVVAHLIELERVGWVARKQRKHGPTEFELNQPAKHVVLHVVLQANPKSSEFKVQSSEFRVQSSEFTHAALNEVRTKENIKNAAAAKMNFELSQNGLENAASEAPVKAVNDEGSEDVDFTKLWAMQHEFRLRLERLFAEFNINGRKRQVLIESIMQLLKNFLEAAKYEAAIVDVRRGLETARERKRAGLVNSAEAVGVTIVEEYIRSGGQLNLFDVPKNEEINNEGFSRQPTGQTNHANKIEASLDF